MSSHYILCPECNFNIGEIYHFITIAKELYMRDVLSNNETDPKKIQLKPELAPPIGFLYDALDLKLCCRMHLTGSTNIQMDAN